MAQHVDIRRADGSKPATREEAQAILDRNPPYDTVARGVELHYVNIDDRGRASLVYSTDKD